MTSLPFETRQRTRRVFRFLPDSSASHVTDRLLGFVAVIAAAVIVSMSVGCTSGTVDTGALDGARDAQDASMDAYQDASALCSASSADDDEDGTPDCRDGCPTDGNKVEPKTCGCGFTEADRDGDGTLDCQDACFEDPDKTAPEQCGCGVDEVDMDGDAVPDCQDGCPGDANKAAPGTCGCGTADGDSDSDGTPDCQDGCPGDANKIAPGTCGCGVAEDDLVCACASSTDDTDGDSIPDCQDGCPGDANKIAPGTCGCGTADGDSDSDGTPDCQDGCPGDANKIAPGTCGCGTADGDSDSDGTPDCQDGCPGDANKIAPGTCGCGTADGDSDSDGTPDCQDGCPGDANKIDPGDCGCGVAEDCSATGPYGGTPHLVPGTIEAEHFDEGGQGIGYSDSDAQNHGSSTLRSPEGVDVKTAAECSTTTQCLGWMATGEWLEYTVDVATSGAYDVDFLVASGDVTEGGQFHLEVDGVDETGSVSVPNTGSYTDWVAQRVRLNLVQGQHVLRFVVEGEYFDFDAIVVATSSGSPYCGDNMCDANESCSNCPSDCGACMGGCGSPIAPLSDTHVRSSQPNASFGSGASLSVGSSSVGGAYLLFDVQGCTSTAKVTLRLYAQSTSSESLEARLVAPTDWQENTTSNTAPGMSEAVWNSMAGVTKDNWVELDVTRLVRSNGLVSIGLTSGGSSVLDFSSREGTHPPQLIVEESCVNPMTDYVINPGESIANAITGKPDKSFLLKAGVHRISEPIKPEQGQRFVGELAANCSRMTVLSGAELVSNQFVWDATSNLWKLQNQTAAPPSITNPTVKCDPGWDRCEHPTDLFVDDRPLDHVNSKAAVSNSTEWFFDYGSDTIWLGYPAGNDPNAHALEVSRPNAAFWPSADNVVIENLIIEKVATRFQRGAIGHQFPADGWRIENSEVRLCHGQGIKLGNDSIAVNNLVHQIGQLAISGGGQDSQILGNIFTNNHGYSHVKLGWEGGSSKFARTQRLKISGNCAYDNSGSGLWTDIQNVDTTYDNNIVFSNTKQGIFHEISYAATIRDNWVGQNGINGGSWLYGANILLSCSQDVHVHHNYVEVSSAYSGNDGIGIVWQRHTGGNGSCDPAEANYIYQASNNTIEHNEITYLGSTGRTGAASDFTAGKNLVWSSGNTFNNNFYHIASIANDKVFSWEAGSRTFSQFQSDGQEANGNADAAVSPIAWSCDMFK